MTNALNINRRFGTVVREGQWLVPTQISVTLTAANARLDFTEAVLAEAGTETVQLSVDLGLGSELTLVTPPGVHVVAENLDTRMGEFDNRVAGNAGVPTHLRIEVTGRLHAGGDLKVRAPKPRRPGQAY
jgi:hypothetical protein